MNTIQNLIEKGSKIYRCEGLESENGGKMTKRKRKEKRQLL